MDSLTYNTEEIPNETHCNKDEEKQVETTPTAINNDNTNENTIATTTATIATTAIINSNQETDLAAMSKDLEESTLQLLPQIKETTTTNSSTSEPLTTSYNSNIATDTTLATNVCATTATTTTPLSSNQFVTLQKPENKSIQLHASTSLKKKRNKFSKCLVGNSNNNNSSSSNSNIGGIGGSISVDHHDSSSSLSNVLASNIKTSLSMTSLPPDEKQESRDGIKAKLKVERPYNSLK
ncbi:probable serine/threonine-protein kinase mkcB, partial [Lucilia sericata]|uniref:probable serine/threonine-protein kinase mkcB n=1 Tax=Lucilia sericata TaxID=13632 RepID=UPI0018A83890